MVWLEIGLQTQLSGERGGIIISYSYPRIRQALQNSHFSMAKGNFFPSLNVGHFVTGAMAILAATGMLIHNRGHGARAGPGWAVLGPHRSCVLLLGFHTISHLARDMKDVSHVTRLPAPALAIIIIITCDRVRHSEYKSSAAWEQSVTRAMCQGRLIFKLVL